MRRTASGVLYVSSLAIPRDLDIDLAFNVHQPRDPHTGRWVQTPMSLAKAAVAGGFTLHVKDMSAVKHGVVVARPGTALLPADNVDAAATAITAFLNKHPDVEHIGGWYNSDDHQIYLDVVDILNDRAEATRLGAARNQIAVFDLDTMEEIPTGGTGHDRPEAGADLATRQLARDVRDRAARVGSRGRSQDGRAREVDLARKQPEGYVRETEEIKARKGQHTSRHKFEKAKWTHPNGHPRCRLCGQEESIDGYCSAQVDLANHFNPAEKRDAKGQWTKDETRAWLKDHPVSAANVVAMWDQATPGEREEGQKWYPEAHKVALALSKRYGVSVQEAAGLLATYSPQTPWGQNVRNAAEVLREHRALGGPGEKIWWHRDPSTPNTVEEREGIMAPGIVKTRAGEIVAGANPDEVFAGGRNKSGTLKPNGLKIRAFFELIANGGSDPKRPAVVIDRHAAGVARGVRFTEEDYNVEGPSTSQKKLAPYVEAYRDAARQISERDGTPVAPEAVQAATWLVRQRLNGAMANQVGKTRKKLGNKDAANLHNYVEQYLPEALSFIPQVGYSELATLSVNDLDLANPSLGRTRRMTTGLLNGEDPIELLRHRGISAPVAEAVVRLAGKGTVTRPNARLGGEDLTLGIRLERDREALYRGAYLIKAAERMDQAYLIDKKPLSEVIASERRFQKMHEQARRGRLEAVTRAQTIARMYGEPDGNRTLVGWYINPLLNNDPECEAANGHNFHAEEGTIIGFPGAVHLNCGCVAGPPIEGAGMVNDAVRGVVPITHIVSRPKLVKRRKSRLSA